LANSRQATKRARQGEGRRQRNATVRSKMRTFLKRVVKAIESGDKTAADAAYKAVVPAIDRSVAKGIMPKNKAARHKSRLNTHVRSM